MKRMQLSFSVRLFTNVLKFIFVSRVSVVNMLAAEDFIAAGFHSCFKHSLHANGIIPSICRL